MDVRCGYPPAEGEPLKSSLAAKRGSDWEEEAVEEKRRRRREATRGEKDEKMDKGKPNIIAYTYKNRRDVSLS